MNSESGHLQEQAEHLSLYALDALPAREASALEAHVGGCAECRRELETLHSLVQSFDAWPTDVLRPPASLRQRLAERIAAERGVAKLPPFEPWAEPEWEDVAPGISCKLLATDNERDQVSMLVRLAPNTDYPPHSHAGLEELHLLEGVLMIDDRTLYPGDYNRAERGTADARVWSETGCTCVLVTSTRDVLS